MIQVVVKHKNRSNPTFVIGLDKEEISNLEKDDAVFIGNFKQFRFAVTLIKGSKEEFIKHLKELGAQYASLHPDLTNGHAE